MQHPILGIFLYLLMSIFALAAAYWIVAPMVDKAPPAKIVPLAAIWATILLLTPILEAFIASFMEDKKITYLSQLAHEWPLCIILLGGLSISLLRRWRKRSL